MGERQGLRGSNERGWGRRGREKEKKKERERETERETEKERERGGRDHSLRIKEIDTQKEIFKEE